MMDKLPGASAYDTFAYHVTLLRDFSSKDGEDPDKSTLSHSGRRRVSRSNSVRVRRNLSFGGRRPSTSSAGGRNRLLKDDQSSNGSMRSRGSERGFRKSSKPNSLNNGRVFGPSSKLADSKPLHASTRF